MMECFFNSANNDKNMPFYKPERKRTRKRSTRAENTCTENKNIEIQEGVKCKTEIFSRCAFQSERGPRW